MEKLFNVSLTLPQATRLVKFIDTAVKAEGLAVAADALALTQIIQSAFQASQVPPPEIPA